MGRSLCELLWGIPSRDSLAGVSQPAFCLIFSRFSVSPWSLRLGVGSSAAVLWVVSEGNTIPFPRVASCAWEVVLTIAGGERVVRVCSVSRPNLVYPFMVCRYEDSRIFLRVRSVLYDSVLPRIRRERGLAAPVHRMSPGDPQSCSWR